MTMTTTITLKCDQTGCGKSMKVDGLKATRKELYKASVKSGWYWKNAARQLCPTHKPSAVNGAKKPAVKAKAKPKVKAKKAAPKPITKPAFEPTVTIPELVD